MISMVNNLLESKHSGAANSMKRSKDPFEATFEEQDD